MNHFSSSASFTRRCRSTSEWYLAYARLSLVYLPCVVRAATKHASPCCVFGPVDFRPCREQHRWRLCACLWHGALFRCESRSLRRGAQYHMTKGYFLISHSSCSNFQHGLIFITLNSTILLILRF